MNFQKFTTFKTILIALVLTFNANQLFAQTTNGIFFQAVARDNFSNPAKDRKIYVQSSIIQTTPTGTKVLTEEHQANTDATGVFSISLGNGVRVGGTASNLTTIDWSKGPFYLNLKVAITPIGGNSNWDYNKEWVDMGTTSFGAVPFALYSASSAKVDDKLNATDTTKMLAVYAKAIKVQSLETAVASKLTAADTLTMLAPYAKAAYTIDSSFFKSQLATKLSLSDTINYTKQKYTDSAIAKKLNIADSSIYVTKSQLASYNFSSGGTTTTTTSVTMDTTSLSNRINLKANTSDLTVLNTSVTSNTASITANTTAIASEAATARAAELVLTNNITSNTASITANETAINLKAPIASPLFTGTVGIGTTNPSSAAALDITSTTQGLLLPRLTYVQKTAISNPVAGLILFCSDCGTSGEMQLYNGRSFVNIVGGTAQFALPVISSTTGAYSITTSSAISGGVITSDGGASITARGLVWGTSAGSSTFSITTGTGTGTFTSSITGLTSGINYYIRAFATNSVGTKYGSEITLNTAQAVATLAATTTVSSIGSTTAVSGGNITYNGGATVTASGVVWSTTSTPTIALATKTTNGAASGTYTSNITGLTPGTLYYVRSYATNSVGTSYGAQTSFTTLNTATIAATVSATSITSNSATTGGDITSDGGATVTSRGLVYGTSAGSATFSVTSGTGTGTYSIGLTGLTPATTYYVRSFATNSVGTVYGTETSFTTIAIAPTLTTTAASSVTKYAANTGGTIISNGGSTILASGICWSTTATPTISDSKTTDGTTSGTFTSSLNSLTAGTTYYVRAYATNAIGTGYGPNESFTTLSTSSNNPALDATTTATSITANSAILGGNITDEGATQVSVRGLVYGTTTGSSTYSVTVGSGAGTFTSTLTGLTQGATYYVRSFATNVQGTSYGAETSFTTQTTPTVSVTAAPTSITTTSAVGGGTITSTGGATITTSGLVWGASTNPENTLSTKTTDGTTSGTFTSSITGLTQGTTYHVRAYATNYLGTSYGPNITFTTLTTPIISATASAISITSSTATIGGEITSDGGAAVTARGVVYGTTTGSATFSVTSGTGTGTYTIGLTGLTPATTYFVRSFATNSVGTVYGTETNFSTLAIAPTLTTSAVSGITKYAASAGGTITSNGGSAITASGICWSTTSTPTTSNSKTTDGTTSGTFTSSLTGLTAGTTYFVRAYATNAIGTSYGANQSFTTLSTPPSQTTVLIGTQTWTDKNLNVANYRNGDPITFAADATQWVAANTAGVGAYTYLKFASGDGGATYGKLYNWYAVNDSRGLAPTGYHIPTLTEWRTLKSTKPDIKTLKSTTSDWEGTFSNVNNNITVALHPNYSNYNGNNSSGFNALPGGSVFNTGTNGNYGSASFWTATQDGSNPLRAEWTYFHQSGLLIGSECCATESIQTGMSIRLVKDNNGVETSPINPILTSTTSATSITSSSAILGGNVTDEGATQVSTRGLVYGTTTGSSTFSVTIGSGAGTFTSTLTGLAQGTTYFVRSYATNAQGTGYGTETSFTTQTTPTVSVTATPTSLTTTSAVGGGTISSTGGATITTSGLVWGANVNPDITLTTKTTDGTASGTFTSSITGLTQGATYHVRAYATNYLGTSYGPDVTFTTITTPTISSTATVTSITGSTATSGGTITVDGGATVTSRGLVWGTTSGASTYSVTSGTGTGTYTSSLTGLTPATNYFVRSFATNSVGTVYGTETSFTTSAGPASKAMITTEPSGAAAGTAFTIQPVVRITDASGNTVTTSTVNVVASIASGTGTLSGTTTVAAVNGIATFTNLILSGATGNFTLAFTPTSLTAATSNSFALSFGTASKAMITTHPSGAVNGVALTTQPVIRITDASGNTVTSSTVNVVASIASGTGGTLSGITTVAAINGVATFTNLVLSGTPGSFTLTFNPTSLTAATSSSFALSVGAASKVMITTQPAGAFNGIEFSTQPIVKITDAGGNTITSSTANVVATIASGSGTLNGTTTVAAVNGVATFTNLKISGTGNHTLTFTAAGGLTAATTNTLNVAELGCAQGGACAIGETGPGGGKVFYYSAAGFNCGPNFSSTCHYLEVAPATWKASAEPELKWDPNGGDEVHANIPNNANPHLLTSEIGLGYKNSVVLFNFYGDNDDYAAGAARRYTGGGKSDWYLGSAVEMNLLAYWSKGQTAPNPLGIASGAMIQGNFQSISGAYWTSSQGIPSEYFDARKQTFGTTASPGPDHKSFRRYVRPIRAF